MTGTVTFGSDPEFFLANATTYEPLCAVGLVGGTKDKPRMVGKFGLQEDNVMAEFTTPPAPSLDMNAENALLGVRTVLASLTPGSPDCIIHDACTVEFTRAMLEAAGPQAMQFGCSPDFDGYAQGARHPRVDPAALRTELGAWRFAGGHIHVGYKDVCELPEYVAAMFCDLSIGLSLTVGGEKQGMRRTLYGMAGRFRPTKYGVEYRTPSNMWLYNPRVREYLGVGGAVLRQLLELPQETQVRLYNEVPWNDVREVINTENSHEAQNLCRWLNATYRDAGFGMVA